MQIFDDKGPKYVRLDDDVSFQILRTNPKLTTNTKLVYDGENLYMDAYQAAPILSTMEYKHHRVWKTGLFNRDIRNFLLGSNTAAYEVGQAVADTIVLDNFDDQFENMYWCGVESINSDLYPQEMGCIAPLYLRKKRPNYFVIFKLETPANTNTSADTNDTNFTFWYDVRQKMKVVKAFDLREGTVIGDYIKKYVEQRDFKYDQSLYVNFSSNEIYYYGIDKKSGVLTQKVENFQEPLLMNDNTITKIDDWITSGFERNNLIFPYIINLEFLFDDKDIPEYRFARYFGMYCNDIDLYDADIDDCIYNREKDEEGNEIENGPIVSTTLTTKWGDEDEIDMDENMFYYIKDKYKNIYSIDKARISGHFIAPGKRDLEAFNGFEPTTVSAYAERIPGVGKAYTILEIVNDLEPMDKVEIINNIYTVDTDGVVSDEVLGTFIADRNIVPGQCYGNRFSCKGSKEDQAKALASVIRTCKTDQFKWITAFSTGNKVVIRAQYPGSNLNRLFAVKLDDISKMKINKLTDNFEGGTDINGCLFKIYASDMGMFIDDSGGDRDSDRYLKCGVGRNNSRVTAILPYINEYDKIDDDYKLIVTDNYGKYVNVSNTNQVEIIDLFYAKIGVLSFFPVKDFDFDTVSSAYGEYSVMRSELDTNLQYTETNINYTIPYGRFFHQDGKEIDTEYDYFFENLIPELSTVNKVVPFINKWGYIDEEKDSCENPYRLNTSKIFDACNFSANTFMQKGDIMEYTHSMPYYINNGYTDNNDSKNEYQYIIVDEQLWSASAANNRLALWADYFSKKTSDGKDPFDKLFSDTSSTYFKNKRYNKKYSRFLKGNDVNRSTTLFRGVKFEITELENGKEVHTGKYNDYKFSFIYIPFADANQENIDNDKHTVHFIKNDEFKFIVGFVFFNVSAFGSGSNQITSLQNCDFNKTFVYAATMGYDNLAYVSSISHGGGVNGEGSTGELIDDSDYDPNDYNQGGGNSGGGSHNSGGNSGTVPDHSGENTAGGESNYYSGDIIYNSGEGEGSSSSTVTEPDTEPTPEPEPVLPTDIVSQTFNLPVSSSSPNVSEPIRLYSNGGYRVMSQNVSSTPSIDGTMIKGLTSNVTGVKLNDSNYTFGNSEFIQTVDGNYEDLSYTTIPAETFSYANEYKMYVNYEGGVTSTNNVTVSLPFMYDLAKGNLRIYENGKYRYFSDDEDDTPKSIVGTLIPELADYQNVHLYEQALSFDRNFSNSETVIDGNETVTLNYATISTAESLRPKGGVTLSVKDSSNTTLKTVKIYTYDSTVNIQFKMETISIDRSNYYTLLGTSSQPNAKQLPYERLVYYLTATDRDGNSVNLNKNVLGFYIGEYRLGSTGYNGNVVSIYDDGNKNVNGWMFKESCTWEKDAYDIIHVAYGDNLDVAQLRVELVDSDPDNILLRGFKPVDNIGNIEFIEGLTYPIGQFIHHYPEDAAYSNTPTYTAYALDPGMITWKMVISDSETGREPQNWEEFYNDRMITMLKDGKCTLRYGWYGNGDSNKSGLASFAGQLTINIIPNWIDYELEDGEMKFYENGMYKIGNGPLKDSRLNIPSTTFNLSINLYKEFSPYTKTGTTTYEFSDSQADSNGRYVVIKSEDSIVEYVGEGVANFEPKPFAYPGVHKMYLNVEGRKYSDFVKLIVTDRNFNLSFNTDVITIDRSNEKSFANQMSTYYKGQTIIDYLNIPTNCQIRFYSFYIYAYLNSFKRDSTGRAINEINGNALTMSPIKMLDSTWKKNQEDKMYIKYGYLGVDKDYPEPETMCDGNYMTVKTSDSNPSMVCLRGITDSGYNHTFNVNQVYTLRDLFGFYPGDATNFSLIMSKFDLTGYDTSAIKFTKLMDSPKSWSEFYDSYIQVTVLKKGLFDCYVNWESIQGIGGKYLIKLRGVTDGTGKKQSSSGSQTTPTPTPDEGTSGGQSSDKPTKGPDTYNVYQGGASSYMYTRSQGCMRIYDDLSFIFVNDVDEHLDLAVPEGRLLGKFSYQEPEVRNLPIDVTATKVRTYDLENPSVSIDTPMSGAENVLNESTNEIVTRKYHTIPASYFNEIGSKTLNVSYVDNYTQKTKSCHAEVITLFEYDFADGHLRIYDNWQYRIVPYSELNGESSGTPRVDGKLLNNKNVDLEKFNGFYLGGTKTDLNFDNSEDVYEFEGDTPVNHHYLTISPANFKGSLWKKDIYIQYKYSDTEYKYSYSVEIKPSDSRIKIRFKYDEITLDRSDPQTIKTQLQRYGCNDCNLKDLITIEVDESVDYLTDSTSSIEDSVKKNLYFYVNDNISTYNNSNGGISVYGGGEVFNCTWKKDCVDVVKIRYAGHYLDDVSMNVRIVQSTDAVYIRRMDVSSFDLLAPAGQTKNFIVGRTYTLRNFISFVPVDVIDDEKHFRHFEIVHIGPSWGENTLNFSFNVNSEYLQKTPSKLTVENAPNSWAEFWNWVTIKPLKAGQPRIYYLFGTDIGGGGGDTWLNVKNP